MSRACQTSTSQPTPSPNEKRTSAAMLRRPSGSVEPFSGRWLTSSGEAGWAELTVCCASIQPDPRVVLALERVTAPDGMLMLISPENPGWFQARGWERLTYDPSDVVLNPHDPELEKIVGPLDPP